MAELWAQAAFPWGQQHSKPISQHVKNNHRTIIWQRLVRFPFKIKLPAWDSMEHKSTSLTGCIDSPETIPSI